MSPRTPRVTAAEMLHALHRAGWYNDHQTGCHIALRHPKTSGSPIVPNHRGDLKTGTIKSILDEAGMTPDELRNLL